MHDLKKSKFYKIYLNNKILWLLPRKTNKKAYPIFWDSESFRPNLQETLKEDVKYKASVIFGKENLPNGTIIWFPKHITIIFKNSKKIFINIR